MAALSFVAMYVLMYAMVNTFSNVIPNLDQFYMAGLMAAPMVIIEVLLMKDMYDNKKMNAVITAIGLIAMIGFFLLIRQQTAISDKQFLKSMIPHHAGAILMCEKASLHDPEIKALCTEIIAGQQAEINQMKTKLNILEK
jgi:hypothetical protein